jgi:predicted metal-binding membrane protein
MSTTRATAHRLPVAVPVAIAVAWAVAVIAQASGKAELLHHDVLIEGHLPVWVALGLFVIAWQVMIAAMMLPSTLPMVRLFAAASTSQERPGETQAAFVAGYLVVWTVFGALAFVGDMGLHHLMDATPWLAARPWLIAGSALSLAGAFQFSGVKDRCLSECRHPGAYLLAHYRRGVGQAYRLGRGHGLFCLGCCWALMLLMFAAGVANLWWMAALTAVMVYEKVGRRGARATRPAGVLLLALALLVFLHPAWLPSALTAA